MPTGSIFEDISIPDIDIWELMFERRTNDFPNNKVIYRDASTHQSYTFDQVKQAAATFGGSLISQWNWKQGEVLLLFAPNSIDIPIIIYGTLFAGGIVSPASPAFSTEELVYQLGDGGATAIVTTAEYLSTALAAAKKAGIAENRVILIGAGDSKYQHFSQFGNSVDSSPIQKKKCNPDTTLAFLVYSSGTTGLPKGVMLSHRNIVAELLMVTAGIGQISYNWRQDRFLGVLPFYHIYGLTMMVHQCLYRGIELVVQPKFNVLSFLGAIQEHKITLVYVAPPILVTLARHPSINNYDLSSLRMMTSAAAPLARELVRAVYARTNVRITQVYGLSETSPTTHVQPWLEWHESIGSVGKLLPNQLAKFVSSQGEEVPDGTDGELWIKGPNVFRGYWKNAGATKNSITPDGYFKTGDVGHQDKSHNIYITDRVKELIKYKGYSIAPAELEGVLLSHPKITDVAVIGIPLDEEHTEAPRAYVVLHPGMKLSDRTAIEIHDWFDKRVAHYKRLRGGIRFIEQIPKSPTGKILRRILKKQSEEEKGLPASKL